MTSSPRDATQASDARVFTKADTHREKLAVYACLDSRNRRLLLLQSDVRRCA